MAPHRQTAWDLFLNTLVLPNCDESETMMDSIKLAKERRNPNEGQKVATKPGILPKQEQPLLPSAPAKPSIVKSVDIQVLSLQYSRGSVA
jgi:hypothetical protein